MVPHFKDEATNASRSLQIYIILIGYAVRRQTLTYAMLADIIYGKAAQHTLAPKLEPLMNWCNINGLPALTAIVVDSIKGLPNVGLKTVAGEFPAEQQKIFSFKWYDILPPTIEQLQATKGPQP